MNHFEQLVAEWLQYKGYFVQVSVLVGKRARGGFEGEIDVVGLNPETHHLLHVECSLDVMIAGKNVLDVGGVRVIRTRDLIHEISDGLKHTSPIGNAVPSNLPLLRTLQLAFDATKEPLALERRLVQPISN